MNVTQKLQIQLPSPLQLLSAEASTVLFDKQKPVNVLVKRDDLIHPIISGNKWRKLKSILENWHNTPHSRIVSFGGGYSNHLHALGYACYRLNIPLTAMVRGNYENRLTPMLSDLKKWQCDIRWLNKIDYKKRSDEDWLRTQLDDYQDSLTIPEGGSAMSVHTGMKELVSELPEHINYLLCPVGSGGTLAGIVQAMHQLGRNTKVLGIAVLKGQDYLEDLVKGLIQDQTAMTGQPWQILHNYHLGGYAKAPEELKSFCSEFSLKTQIAIEPVYSGKLFFALRDLLQESYFPEGSTVCALHTGGIQGGR